jgi:DNA helicase II / ATP-dependent DNA helicase PcrA
VNRRRSSQPSKSVAGAVNILYLYFAMMELSSAQRKAVEYLDGPQIILAGAGSGKTRVIVAKAQYLIEQKGYAPDSIFVITYSNKTQAELEDRMSVLGDKLPLIKTFHSFGMDLIAEFGQYLKLSTETNKVSEHRLWQYLKRAIGELTESDLLDTNQSMKVYLDLKAFISRAKDELVLPEQIIVRAEQELATIPAGLETDDAILNRAKWSKVLEAAKIFQSYERIKSQDSSAPGGVGGIDYGDMIVLTHRLLSSEKVVGASLRKRCRYILVDEFQDANFAQVEILHLIASNTCGVTVVGDDDQAIYRFRGASFASFRLFQKLFPGWKIFRLEENYRSQANIVKAAQALIEVDPTARFDPDKKMTASKPEAAKVIVRKCPDDYSEALAVATEIEHLLKDEAYQQPSSIAVLVRARRHKDVLVKILERKGIDYFYDRQVSELATKSAALLLSLYEFTVNDSRADLVPSIMNHFVPNLRPEIEHDINYQLSRQGTNPLTILAAFVADHGEDSPSGLEAMITLLSRLKTLVSENTPLQLLEKIIIETGIFKDIITGHEILDNKAMQEISGILKTAEKFLTEYPGASHTAFLEYLDWQSAGGENDAESEVTSPVVIQTVHGSKGLEYPVVFMIGLSNRRFPPQKQSSLLEFPAELYNEELPPGDYRISEERRLFYVGMTRARELLYLYGVEKKGTKISQFISELSKSPAFAFSGECEIIGRSESEIEEGICPDKILHDPHAAVIIPGNQPLDQAVSESLNELWEKQSATAKTPEEFEKLKVEFSEKLEAGLAQLKNNIQTDIFHAPEIPRHYTVGNISYTDITAFKDCPLKFYFRKVLYLPSPSGPQQSLGSVIHSVLEEAGKSMMAGQKPVLNDLLTSFETHWRKAFLDDPDSKERLRQRARDLLERFINIQAARISIPIALEQKFKIELAPELDGKTPNLTGRIDRVDKVDGELEIIDYKSGKQPSASDLKTDLQLPIYALACRELFHEYPRRLTYIFLGDNTTHDASYDPVSLEKIKSDILETISRINHSDFAATPGNICARCDYRRICPARAE